MLIMTRRPGPPNVNTIDITALRDIKKGERIEVRVLGVIGNQVRFGIEASRNFLIDRREISERRALEAHDNAA